MSPENLASKLAAYMPQAASPIIANWLIKYNIKLIITNARISKLGDFRVETRFQHTYLSISVNGNLNQYSFLQTLLHEFAHFFTWQKYSHNVKPHGPEWKQIYIDTITPFLTNDFFPDDLIAAIRSNNINPKASSCSNPQLIQALRRYDAHNTPELSSTENGVNYTTLDLLPEGAKFILKQSGLNLEPV
ncbi:MAG: SprT-like domain-containing protein [Sphingobacteriales bacterium]|jgi:SprT protein|nr:SprT-like domain-containing protein [Sphingobacteriales bacterium]MBP9140858.1 SprT-like domain-containing protein [Chitinophagales bacterium]MDA0200045.1 SprT-like domain-containing protein [Bacteroidota bacterium]MBK7527016.1 SprT-like domain-containing protein [Sphingobacteriales bacterium]MBK8677505.1 SprT-like domain-containing protein [Sphingobacteriales bacterium]